MVIIISNKEDAHLPFVTRHLKGAFVRIDVEDILHKKGLSFSIQKGKATVTYNGQPLKGITGIWVRRPIKAGNNKTRLPVRDEYYDYVKDALNAHFGQLYVAFPDAIWISDNFSIGRAEHKFLQLVEAQKVGFSVPDTLFSSDPTAAEAFVNSQQQTVVKTLSRFAPRKDDRISLIMWSHLVRPTDPVRYDGLHVAPSIFQQAIDPAYELRVTVVGTQVFAAKIVAANNTTQGVRDWRMDQRKKDRVSFESFKLDTKLQEKCVALTHSLGLNYGAIDLITDKQGQTWFLEINPNGQWAFVEHTTGLEIGHAIANLLEGKKA